MGHDIEDKIKHLLSGALNSELKCLVLGFCTERDKSPYLALKDILGEDAPIYQRVMGFYRDSFVPQNLTNSDKSLTDLSIKYGKLLCTLCLDFSTSGRGLSLTKLFGTQNNACHPSYSRFRIIEEMKNGMEKRFLTNTVDLSDTQVFRHLRALDRVGVIYYSSRRAEVLGESIYSWKEDATLENIQIVKTLPLLSERVAKLCYKNVRITKSEIATSLGYGESMHSHIRSILKAFRDSEKIEPSGFGGLTRSKISFRTKTNYVKQFCRRIRLCLEDSTEGAIERDILGRRWEMLNRDHSELMGIAKRAIKMHNKYLKRAS